MAGLAPALATALGLAGLSHTVAFAAGHEAAPAESPPPFRSVPIQLAAADFIPAQQLSGRGYAVDPVVMNDGWVNTYRLKTDWGHYRIAGTDALLTRIHEVAVLRAMEELKRTSVFADAVKGGVTAPLTGAKKLVTSPVATTTGAVKGTGRWIGNIGRSAVSSDPHQEGVVSAVVSYAGAKRAFALDFGVDPWTDFEPVQNRLGEIARASVAGGLTTAAAMGAITEGTDWGMAVTALGLTSDMNDMLADEPAQRIRRLNREKLEKLGVARHEADAFLRNYNYSPMQHTVLVGALEQMGRVRGREIFVAHATAAPEKAIAYYMLLRAQMMTRWVQTYGTADVVEVDGYPWLKTRKGAIAGVLPVDYMAWSAELAAAERAASAKIAAMGDVDSKQVWVEGQVDPVARRMLESRGWLVKGRAGLTPRGRLAAEVAPQR